MRERVGTECECKRWERAQAVLLRGWHSYLVNTILLLSSSSSSSPPPSPPCFSPPLLIRVLPSLLTFSNHSLLVLLLVQTPIHMPCAAPHPSCPPLTRTPVCPEPSSRCCSTAYCALWPWYALYSLDALRLHVDGTKAPRIFMLGAALPWRHLRHGETPPLCPVISHAVHPW